MIGDIKESDMDTNLLKIFLTVANRSSISLAAKELNFAQSNVTSRIKQLEKNIGYELFHRVPTGVILTKEGKHLYTHAKDIVKRVEDAIVDMKNLEHQGSLRVGSTESNAATRIVPFLIDLHKKYPKMSLELFTGTTEYVTKMILNYDVDVAFISGEPKSEELIVLNRFEEDMVILEPKDCKTPEVFLSFKKGCTYNAFLQNHYKSRGHEEIKTLEFGSLETILGCVKAGMGRTFLPMNIVKKLGFEEDLKIVKLDDESSNIPTCMVCRRDYTPSIINYLKEINL